MSTVTVRATGLLKDKLPPNASILAGQSVADAVASLQIQFLDGLVAVVNNRLVSSDYILEAGDKLHLVQSISGG